MYEDDGETLNYKNGAFFKTAFTVSEDGNKLTFLAEKAEGEDSIVPAQRTFNFMFRDVVSADVIVTVDGKRAKNILSKCGKGICVSVTAKAAAKVKVMLSNCVYLANEDEKTLLVRTVSKFQMSTDLKGFVFNGFVNGKKKQPKVSDDFTGPIEEIKNLYR